MSTYQRVKEFHETFDIPHADKTPDEILEGRLALVFEEFKEVLDAAGYCLCVTGRNDTFGNRVIGIAESPFEFKDIDKAHFLKELADLDYVVAGTAEVFKWDFDEAGRRVHASNMSKLDENGKPVYREDGKVLKGPNYKEPYLGDLV